VVNPDEFDRAMKTSRTAFDNVKQAIDSVYGGQTPLALCVRRWHLRPFGSEPEPRRRQEDEVAVANLTRSTKSFAASRRCSGGGHRNDATRACDVPRDASRGDQQTEARIKSASDNAQVRMTTAAVPAALGSPLFRGRCAGF
jgi:hypothetical protein